MLHPLFFLCNSAFIKGNQADDLFLDVLKGFFVMRSLDPIKLLRISVGESAAWVLLALRPTVLVKCGTLSHASEGIN